jgi:sporulation protein YlmC with PRC-barrel domain
MMEAEQLLGRRVVDAGGSSVGVVLDVGLGEQRAPKFLLVGPGQQQRFVRVEMRDVAEVLPDAVRLRQLDR